jgi:2-dehydropantoate 2-reductase
LTLREILQVEPTRMLLLEAMSETDSVARANGVTIERGYVEALSETLRRFENNTRSSLYHDLIHGKPLEIEALAGTVVRLGRLAGVPTPINSTVYAALLPYHLQHLRNATP